MMDRGSINESKLGHITIAQPSTSRRKFKLLTKLHSVRNHLQCPNPQGQSVPQWIKSSRARRIPNLVYAEL